MFCQLETLRHCLPSSVRCTLNELPESLDETYERVLKEIKRPNRDHAHRLFQCLVAATRPLEVKELAEVLAVDFDDAEGIPKLKPDWRWEDEEQAILTSCSSLITTVKIMNLRAVQFAHFSVKEYLTSERLSTSNGDVSRYHIDLEAAHTTLAQACMSILLQPGRVKGKGAKMSPLVKYAARHWATHAQVERVSTFLQKPMEYLFDMDKPYFTAWLQLYDIDTYPSRESSPLSLFAVIKKSDATPLYYAALCGFEGLVERLVVKHPQHVDMKGGYYVTLLFAAMARRHYRIVELLRREGAHKDVRGTNGLTPLHSAAWYGDIEMVQVSLDHKVDVNASNLESGTSSYGSRFLSTLLTIHRLWSGVIRSYLGTPVNSRTNDGQTPLHQAGTVEVVRLLLEHGANVNAVDNEGRAPLHSAGQRGKVGVVRMLLEHGVNVGAADDQGRTVLHTAAAEHWAVEVVRMLVEHGANVGAVDRYGETPLHAAAQCGNVEVVRVLLQHDANVGVVDSYGRTLLHIAAAEHWTVEVVRVLLQHGAKVGVVDSYGNTPLHAAVQIGNGDVVPMLLMHGAKVGAVDNYGNTPLHAAAQSGNVDVVLMLLMHGANVGAVDNYGRTPLHAAAKRGIVDVLPVLLMDGANVHAVDNQGRTPLLVAVAEKVARVLLRHGANVDAVDNQGRTPLLHAVAVLDCRFGVVHELLEHGANVAAVDNQGRTPLHAAVEHDEVAIVRVLLEHGANVDAVDNQCRTPLHVAAADGGIVVVRELLEHGANVAAVDNEGRAPLFAASAAYYIDDDILHELLESGLNVDVVYNQGRERR